MSPACVVTDAFRGRIVGWRVAGHMRTQMVLDALETAYAAANTDHTKTENQNSQPARNPG